MEDFFEEYDYTVLPIKQLSHPFYFLKRHCMGWEDNRVHKKLLLKEYWLLDNEVEIKDKNVKKIR